MAPSNTTAASLSEEIDQLLQHYLELLDQYTTLRSQLTVLQSSVHQHISRANFSAERGIRYGADFYDARMQATRVCHITVPNLHTATTDVVGVQQDNHAVGGKSLDGVERGTTAMSARAAGEERSETKDGEGIERTTPTVMDTAYFTISTAPNNRPRTADESSAGHENGDEKAETRLAPKDPLRMFGLLTPQSLRQAQSESIKSVENIMPKLVSIDAEMKEVEIRIRRARKWKAKAENKEGNDTGNTSERGVQGAGQRQEIVV